MLIGEIILTDNGIKIYDVDGSLQVELRADDALYLTEWLEQKHGALLEIVRHRIKREDRKDVQA